jgi:RNA polymerase sigma factor (sigma-70 family)
MPTLLVPAGSTPGEAERDEKNAAAAVTPGAGLRSPSVDPDSERALVAGLKRGEAAAFDAAYAAYRARLFGFLVRMARRRELAEDLLQETWIRLATRSASLADDTRLGAWLFTVARNLLVSHVRATRLDADLVGEQEPAGGAVTPFEELAGSQAQRRLEAALAAMAPAYREVLLLVAVERMTPQQAAEVLGARPEAVRQRLSRARGMLEAALQDVQDAGRDPDDVRMSGQKFGADAGGSMRPVTVKAARSKQ